MNRYYQYLPTDILNINYLAPSISEIWRGFQYKKVGGAGTPDTP